MEPQMRAEVAAQLHKLKAAGLYKAERELHSAQGPHIRVAQGEVLNFCANNYLALANAPEIVQAARAALEHWGFGMASVRFICGTQSIHTELERRLTQFLGTEDTILYGSCFDANGGLFETLLDERDAVISDELNHASIIDGLPAQQAGSRRPSGRRDHHRGLPRSGATALAGTAAAPLPQD